VVGNFHNSQHSDRCLPAHRSMMLIRSRNLTTVCSEPSVHHCLTIWGPTLRVLVRGVAFRYGDVAAAFHPRRLPKCGDIPLHSPMVAFGLDGDPEAGLALHSARYRLIRRLARPATPTHRNDGPGFTRSDTQNRHSNVLFPPLLYRSHSWPPPRKTRD